MCSNFSQLFFTGKRRLPKFIDPNQLDMEFKDLNVFPHQNAYIIRQNKIIEASFSLIPSWSKERRPKFATYNARIETVLEKPTWKESFISNHCIVPITAFREPVYEGPYSGNIVQFYRKDEILLAAGIYNEWVNKETGEVVPSFAIVTKEPYPFIEKAGHDRSPLFLSKSNAQKWLNMENENELNQKEFLLSSFELFEDFNVEKYRELKKKG